MDSALADLKAAEEEEALVAYSSYFGSKTRGSLCHRISQRCRDEVLLLLNLLLL